MAVAEEIDNATAGAPDDGAENLPFIQPPMGKNFVRAAGAAAIVAVLIGLWLWNKPPEYAVLFSNYTDRDGGAITAELDKMQVKHKFSDNGTAILVPAEQVHDIRLKLAAQGLPRGGRSRDELDRGSQTRWRQGFSRRKAHWQRDRTHNTDRCQPLGKSRLRRSVRAGGGFR